MTTLQTLTSEKSVRLTTFKRDGTGVETPVSIAVDGDHAYFRTWDTAWKARRLRHNPQIELAPQHGGPGMKARAELVNGEEAKHAAQLLARKNPVLQRIVVPAFHKLSRKNTIHYRVTPA